MSDNSDETKKENNPSEEGAGQIKETGKWISFINAILAITASILVPILLFAADHYLGLTKDIYKIENDYKIVEQKITQFERLLEAKMESESRKYELRQVKMNNKIDSFSSAYERVYQDYLQLKKEFQVAKKQIENQAKVVGNISQGFKETKK